MTQRCQYRSQDSGGGRIVGARAFSVFQVSDTGQQHAACNSSLLGAQGNGQSHHGSLQSFEARVTSHAMHGGHSAGSRHRPVGRVGGRQLRVCTLQRWLAR